LDTDRSEAGFLDTTEREKVGKGEIGEKEVLTGGAD
jgi:hypothetical protein